MLFMKRPQIRKFTYRPQFYTPDEELDEEEEGPRIQFRRIRRTTTRSTKRRSGLILVLLVIILLFMIHYFNNLQKAEKESEIDTFQVEEIIIK